LSDGFFGRGRDVFQAERASTVPNLEVSPENYDIIRKDAGLENVSLPYDQELLNQMAYESQSAAGNLLRGVGRVATRAVAEVLSTPGYLVAAGTGMTGNGWDNAWISSIQEGMNNINQEYLPTYVSTAVQEGGIIGKLMDSAWWGTTGADGIGFMVGMMGGGALMNTVKAGRLLTGTAGALARGAEALGGTTQAAEMLAAGSRLSTSGLGKFARTMQTISQSQVAANRAQSIMNVFANTIIESSAEANNTYKNIRQELINKGYSEEEANKIAGNAASNVFSANVGILAVSNTIMEKYVFRGFDTQANISRRMSGLKFFDDAPVTAGAKGAAKEAVEDVAEGVAAEGVERAAVGEAAEQVGVELEQRAAGEVAEGTAEGIARGAADDLAATVIREGARTSKGIAKRTLKENLGIYAKNIAINGASEGLFQEGLQTSTEQYFTEAAMKGELNNPWNIPGNLFAVGEKYLQNLTELESTESSREFYEAVALGGILGAGASTIGTGGDLRAEEEALFGSPGTQKRGKFLGSEFAGRTLDRITGRKEKAPSKGMVNYFTEMVKANSIPYGELLKKDENGNFEFDENGQYVLDQEKIKAVAGASEELTKMMSMNALAEAFLSEKEANGTITQDERVHLEGVKNNRESFLLSPYISTEGGVEIFKAHVDQIVEKMYSENTKADNFFLTQEKMRLIDKVERLSKQRRIIENTNHSTTSFLDKEPGTADEKMMFRNLVMADKMNVGAQMDYYDNALKDIDDEIKKTEAEVERNKEADRVNPQLEQELSEKKDRKKHLDDMYKETVKSYNELFDNNKLLKEFNDFKNNEGKYGMSEEERLRRTIDDPEYFNKLFDKKGIDYKEDFDEIHIDFRDKRLLLSRKNGKLLLTDEGRKYVYNWNPETRRVEQADLMRVVEKKDKKPKVILENIEDFETSPETIEVLLKRSGEEFTIYDKEESKAFKEDRIRAEGEALKNKAMAFVSEQINSLQEALSKANGILEERNEKLKEFLEAKEKDLSEEQLAIDAINQKVKEYREAFEKLTALIKHPARSSKLKAAKALLEEAEASLSDAQKRAAHIADAYDQAIKKIKTGRDSIAQIKRTITPLKNKLEVLEKYKTSLENLKINLENEAEEQLAEDQRALMLAIIKEKLDQEGFDTSKIETIQELVDKSIKSATAYATLFEEDNQYFKLLNETDDEFAKIEKQLNDKKIEAFIIVDAIESLKRNIKDLGQRIDELRAIENRNPEQADRLREFVNERLRKIGKSGYYAQILNETNKSIGEIQDSLNKIKKIKVDTLANIFGRIKSANQELDELRNNAVFIVRNEMYKDADPEATLDDVSEQAKNQTISSQFARPTTPFLLTGRDVEFDTVNGMAVDRFDAEGNLIRNQNPYAKAWFGFTNALAKMDKKGFGSAINSNLYIAVTYDTADKEMKMAIDESIAYDKARLIDITEEQKKSGVYIFVLKKNKGGRKTLMRSGKNLVFTTMRSEKDIEKKLGLKGEDLEKASYEYRQFMNSLKGEISNKKRVVLKIAGIGSRHFNRTKGKKGHKIKEIFSFLYGEGASKDALELYTKNLKVADEEEVKVGKRNYRLNKGTVYYTAQNAPPLILNQRTLTENEVDTVIALLSTEQERIGDESIISLLGRIINFGKRSSNVFELFKRGDTIYYKEGRESKPKTINADIFRKPEEERTDAEKKEVEDFKTHLRKKYFYVNKRLLDQQTVMPKLVNGKIELETIDNYSEYLLDNVLTAKVNPEYPFVQSNLIIDKKSFGNPIKDKDESSQGDERATRSTSETKKSTGKKTNKKKGQGVGLSDEEYRSRIQEVISELYAEIDQRSGIKMDPGEVLRNIRFITKTQAVDASGKRVFKDGKPVYIEKTYYLDSDGKFGFYLHDGENLLIDENTSVPFDYENFDNLRSDPYFIKELVSKGLFDDLDTRQKTQDDTAKQLLDSYVKRGKPKAAKETVEEETEEETADENFQDVDETEPQKTKRPRTRKKVGEAQKYDEDVVDRIADDIGENDVDVDNATKNFAENTVAESEDLDEDRISVKRTTPRRAPGKPQQPVEPTPEQPSDESSEKPKDDEGGPSQKVLDLQEAKRVLDSLEETNQVTKNCF